VGVPKSGGELARLHVRLGYSVNYLRKSEARGGTSTPPLRGV
jgi:hypothetical protein